MLFFLMLTSIFNIVWLHSQYDDDVQFNYFGLTHELGGLHLVEAIIFLIIKVRLGI